MGRWNLNADEESLYFANKVDTEVVKKVQEVLDSGKRVVYVSFNVTGRTFHQILSYQLAERVTALYGPKVDVQIGYNYECTIKRLASDDTSVRKITSDTAGTRVTDGDVSLRNVGKESQR